MTFNKVSKTIENRVVSDIEEWNENGVLILRNFIPNDLIEAYVEERTKLIGGTEKWHPGWSGPTPYLHVKSMLNLATYTPLQNVLKRILIDPAGLHLCLTGFKSTERKLHQDSYLNPPGVDDHYVAVWFALDDIHPDSGPFEYYEKSHKWPVIQRELVMAEEMKKTGKIDQDTWPSDTQDWVGSACEEYANSLNASKKTFIAKKGDVLIWHSFLVHRGSKPNDPNIERRALIAHYSSINHRPDMPDAIHYSHNTSNGHFFNFNHELR